MVHTFWWEILCGGLPRCPRLPYGQGPRAGATATLRSRQAGPGPLLVYTVFEATDGVQWWRCRTIHTRTPSAASLGSKTTRTLHRECPSWTVSQVDWQDLLKVRCTASAIIGLQRPVVADGHRS